LENFARHKHSVSFVRNISDKEKKSQCEQRLDSNPQTKDMSQ
jgi:hypothetical protein